MTDGPNLVLLPGLLCTEALWQHQISHLEDRARCQVACLTCEDSVTVMAEHVLSWAPKRFALAGLSMGGYVAMEIMRLAPDRVERLALLNTRAQPDSEKEARRRRGLISLAQKGKFKGVTPHLLPMLIHPSRLGDDELAGLVMTMAERVGKEAFVRQQMAILDRRDQRPHLPAIKCPTLLICGQQDSMTPPDLHQDMADLIPGAQLKVLDCCGHLSPLEQPVAVNRLLSEWLDGPKITGFRNAGEDPGLEVGASAVIVEHPPGE